METYAVQSFDGTPIHIEVSGTGENTLLFLHGWFGNGKWWNCQRDFFKERFKIVQMDLAGHGKSGKTRVDWSIAHYARDVQAVVNELGLRNLSLIGHSMSGSIIVESYLLFPEKVRNLILVDTFQNLDHMLSAEEVGPFLNSLRKDFINSIRTIAPQFMFAKTSPKDVMERVIGVACEMPGKFAVDCLESFYKTPILDSCKKVKVPVRAINSDFYPTLAENNRKYFSDFDFAVVQGVGHYPMLESPEVFNRALDQLLTHCDK